ncbi:hypothetical protein Sru01_24690 [Sphaerisporangium rufum]|uniref:Uncharacterized protein n=2 Tax=Sphaerisporangium rufum TaxID=1381558 RepID=A0A919V0J1_9ACTN|nr:hypothetical protein Sru01_24690 [Sphaerisporangium rufum]
MPTNGGPRESFYQKIFTEAYARPGTEFQVRAEDGGLHLTLTLDPKQARFLGRPERLRYELLPISETHFLMPATHPLEDPQTVAIYDSHHGRAQYLHTNCRVHPRTPDGL